jgi:hypothetical protein
MALDFTPDEEEKFNIRVSQLWNRKSTKELLAYDSFSVKNELFGFNQNFTELSDFVHFIDRIKEWSRERVFIFRGVGRSSYRLFNKAQRNFRANASADVKNEKLFHASISEMLENAKRLEQKVLPDYFNGFGVKENDVAILSFLQHHGAPTPLMDWTYDINVAIYFALNDLSKNPPKIQSGESKRETDEYFSIYWMLEDMPQYMLNHYKQLSVFRNGATYKTLRKRKVAHISEIYQRGKPKLLLQNNFRILKQKGIFIYNNSSHLPLEEIFFTHSSMYYLARSPKDDSVPRSPLFCMNIHKSLALAIEKEIRKKGYCKSSLFPDAKRLAQKAIPGTLY